MLKYFRYETMKFVSSPSACEQIRGHTLICDCKGDPLQIAKLCFLTPYLTPKKIFLYC